MAAVGAVGAEWEVGSLGSFLQTCLVTSPEVSEPQAGRTGFTRGQTHVRFLFGCI